MHHVVFNPVAGRGRALASRDELETLLLEAGVSYRLTETSGPGHATQLAAASPPGSVVVAVGGDGTVHEVVEGLVAAEGGLRVGTRTLGVVPVGSGDDFAFALGHERGDVRAAVRRLAAGRTRTVDLGTANGRPFANAFSTGFDADVAARLHLVPRAVKGMSAYLYALAISLGKLRPVGVRVSLDGVEAFEGRALLVACQNGPRSGGSFLYAPEAVNDDGRLDVVIAGDLSLVGTLALLPRVMTGRHLGHPKVSVVRARTVAVEWDDERHGHVDGEAAGSGRRFTVDLVAGGLRVVA